MGAGRQMSLKAAFEFSRSRLPTACRGLVPRRRYHQRCAGAPPLMPGVRRKLPFVRIFL